MLMPAQHQKPAATTQGATQDQFQCICILLLKSHVLQISTHSSVPVHIRQTGLHWERQQHSRALTRATRRWHRTNENYLKWSFARKRLEASNEITQQLSPASHDSKLQRIWDKSLKLTPQKPRGKKPQKSSLSYYNDTLFDSQQFWYPDLLSIS